jgi:hypothetical protein
LAGPARYSLPRGLYHLQRRFLRFGLPRFILNIPSLFHRSLRPLPGPEEPLSILSILKASRLSAVKGNGIKPQFILNTPREFLRLGAHPEAETRRFILSIPKECPGYLPPGRFRAEPENPTGGAEKNVPGR